MEFENLELTNEVRDSLSGSYIQTSDGYVHYQMQGDGECVILVHGTTKI